MLLFRFYIALLTLIFLGSTLAFGHLGVLQGVVSTSAILFLILDITTEMLDLKRLETQLASLTNGG